LRRLDTLRVRSTVVSGVIRQQANRGGNLLVLLEESLRDDRARAEAGQHRTLFRCLLLPPD
jgi:hypothetical protein